MERTSPRAAQRMDLLRRSAGEASRRHEVGLANMTAHLPPDRVAAPAAGGPQVPPGRAAEIAAISDELTEIARSRDIGAAQLRDLTRIADELGDIGRQLAISRS